MSQLLLLYALSTVLNAVQFTQFSTFPYVCKEADISDLSQGYIKTFFIALELVGSPLVGALVNKLGLRTGLAIVFISTACSCFLLSITNVSNTTISTLFLYLNVENFRPFLS